jgi:AraC-like DNA-binding protein
LAAQNAFTSFIDIPCSLVTRSGSWIVVYASQAPSWALTHVALGGRKARTSYNALNVEQVLETREPRQTELNGFSDLWVPIESQGRCDNLLVTGPFLRRRWSAAEIRESYQELTGQRPEPGSASLLRYARTVLATQVLGEQELANLTGFLRNFAELLAGVGDARAHAEQFWHQTRRDFSRLPSAQLRKGALLVDPVASWIWAEGMRPWDAEELGVEALPNVALAVLPVPNAGAADESLELLVRAERFQIECVALARRMPSTIAARLEDTGALFLLHVSPKLNRTQRRLLIRERTEQIQGLVQRHFGGGAYVGVGEPCQRSHELHRSVREAVFAVELCVHRQQPVCFYADEMAPASAPTARSAARLVGGLLESFGSAEPALLEVARMDYVRAVLQEAAGRSSVLRVHFEHALFALLGAVTKLAPLDAKTERELETRLRSSLSASLTTVELITAFREAWDMLARLSAEPSAEARHLRLERARVFIAQHCGGPITLGQVARHAGFSRNYFSRIFKDAFQRGFEQYLTEQRLLKAERLLSSTALPVGRIASESGFASAPHFAAAFRKRHGLTPTAYRDGSTSDRRDRFHKK